ncbi:MAG: hypothetical protein IGR92_12165 [Leptolyngbyaceae cyanobacterium T60_A2020_046]|nr:hypothetical protein [Leptolyngbyaceae cyanobacterium T60_A2020_046]
MDGLLRLGHGATDKLSEVYRQNARVYRRYGRWFLLALLAALVDGKLLIAIAAGLSTYRLVACDHSEVDCQITRVLHHLRRLLADPQRRRWVLTASAFAVTYGTAALWADPGTAWAPVAVLTLGMTNAIALLALSQRDRAATPPESSVQSQDAALGGDRIASQWHLLTHADPLRRLMAVRDLTHWATARRDVTYVPGSPVTLRSHLIDCFHLMLAQEPEPLVRTALREALTALHPTTAALPQGTLPLSSLHSNRQRADAPIPENFTSLDAYNNYVELLPE